MIRQYRDEITGFYIIERDGESHTLAEWAQITGINAGTLRHRIELKTFDLQKILCKPRSFPSNRKPFNRESEKTAPPTGTLCWRCINSVPSPRTGAGCSWSRKFVPVEGWEAIPTTIDKDRTHSYLVKKCPEFTEG